MELTDILNVSPPFEFDEVVTPPGALRRQISAIDSVMRRNIPSSAADSVLRRNISGTDGIMRRATEDI